MFIDPFLPDDTDQRNEPGDEQTDILVLPVTVEFFDPFDEARFGLSLDHIRAFHGQHDDAVFDLCLADFP